MGFRLTAWVLLPDCGHAILFPRYPAIISRVMESVKVSSTRLVHGERRESGRFWQGRFFDRALRTVKEHREKVEHIHLNPGRAGLVSKAKEWKWSRVRDDTGSVAAAARCLVRGPGAVARRRRGTHLKEMASRRASEQRNSALPTTVGPASSAVEGEVTRTVRVIGLVIAGLVAGAILAGIWKVSTGVQPGTAALVGGLFLTEVILAGVLILLGSVVEGFGYGLSLGTRWPYTRNIVVLMVRGDPEAAHRVVATLVGLIALALAVLAPSSATLSGLALVVITALLGIGTLHVLAGRVPAFVHGAHGLLAYGVFLSYLTGLAFPGIPFWSYLGAVAALHPLLLAVLLGGMTTGQRGFGQPIGAFYRPQRLAHWTVAAHILAALSVVATLGWLMPAYPLAFYLAVAQIAVGFLLFHAVNLKPKNPGIIVAFHQCMVLLITAAIVPSPLR